ncbi:CDP-diacylglycerol--glycerol-3-phosphate 3-phosphatidyltransferase [Smaragdicoccus niigatensis]|uniref:CDP-diacylglycerol--glycerol-3-phosphate 3-phosphatidyltransferase n=1 Tax=Smaragdicoccus niigatensis TaxID=359359 RepID=UPI00036F3A7F|nr:CDP-diacylglycerol--glycerol-3-phosphate 3-phosphatidyltransferase [Smaragdicoccus niigatensis]
MAATQSDTPSNLNIANALTVLRLLAVPVFVFALLFEGGDNATSRLIAAGVFFAAIITDAFDGHLARRYDLVTDFGKLADPIADKALIGAALIGLSFLGELAWWITIVILVRELGITAMRFAVKKYGVMPAGRGGKIKTVVQTVAIGLYLLPLVEGTELFILGVMYLAVALTVLTGLDYVVDAYRLRKSSIATAA